VHDLRSLRDNLESLRDGMRRRRELDTLAPRIDRAEVLDARRRALIQQVEEKKATRNAVSQEVARLKKQKESADDLIRDMRVLGEEIAIIEGTLSESERELDQILMQLPNVPLADVPEGGEENNRVVRAWGEPRASDGVRPHWEIGEQLGILDLARRSRARDSSCSGAAERGSCARSCRSCSISTRASRATKRPGCPFSSRARR
jgi:seryl-tRNA synthetase